MTILTQDATWRKSKRSQQNGQCGELAHTGPALAVRDSKNPDGPTLDVPERAAASFLSAAKVGKFGG